MSTLVEEKVFEWGTVTLHPPMQALNFEAVYLPLGCEKPVSDLDSFLDAYDQTPGISVTEVREQTFVERVTEAIEAVVARAGRDFRYEAPMVTCDCGICTLVGAVTSPNPRYIKDGKGDCLIGQVLIHMGQSPERIAQFEGVGAMSVITPMFIEEADATYVASGLRVAQVKNDAGAPWGEALDAYHAYMAGIR